MDIYGIFRQIRCISILEESDLLPPYHFNCYFDIHITVSLVYLDIRNIYIQIIFAAPD